jgi:hypothetical protein
LSAAERRICVDSVDKYLGRYFAMDALVTDRELSRRVAGLGRRSPESGDPMKHSVAREIRLVWAGMFHRYAVEGPLHGCLRHVPRTLLYAFRLDWGRGFPSAVVESYSMTIARMCRRRCV